MEFNKVHQFPFQFSVGKYEQAACLLTKTWQQFTINREGIRKPKNLKIQEKKLRWPGSRPARLTRNHVTWTLNQSGSPIRPDKAIGPINFNQTHLVFMNQSTQPILTNPVGFKF